MHSTQNAVASHEYRCVPITALAESATNPRKRFDAKSLEELAPKLEDICAVERRDLADLIHSFTVGRPAFINRLGFMSSFPHRLLMSKPIAARQTPAVFLIG